MSRRRPARVGALVVVVMVVGGACAGSGPVARGAPPTTVAPARRDLGSPFLSGSLPLRTVVTGTNVGVLRLDRDERHPTVQVDLGRPVAFAEALTLADSVALLVRTCTVVNPGTDEDLGTTCLRGGRADVIDLSPDGTRVRWHERVANSAEGLTLAAMGTEPVVMSQADVLVPEHGRWVSQLPAGARGAWPSCVSRMGRVGVSFAGPGGTTLTTTAPAVPVSRPVLLPLMATGTSTWVELPIPGATGRLDEVACAPERVIAVTTDARVSTLWFIGGTAADPTFRSIRLGGIGAIASGQLGAGELLLVASADATTRTLTLCDAEGHTVRTETDPMSSLATDRVESLPAGSYYAAVGSRVLRIGSAPDQSSGWVVDVPA